VDDVFLAEKVSNVIISLCWRRNIVLLEEVVVGTRPGSLLDEAELAVLIRNKKPTLADKGMRIRIERDMIGENAAEIRSIRGKTGPPIKQT
jgi:hypothetical protein